MDSLVSNLSYQHRRHANKLDAPAMRRSQWVGSTQGLMSAMGRKWTGS